MQEFTIRPIGVITTPFNIQNDSPIQSGFSEREGIITVFKEYQQGLEELEGFSHIILIYYFHEVEEEQLVITPFLDSKPKGVFATRFNKRPNKLGLSIVELLRREENRLFVKNVDMVDNTPLIDIKPLVPEFDLKNIENCRIGWLEKKLQKK